MTCLQVAGRGSKVVVPVGRRQGGRTDGEGSARLRGRGRGVNRGGGRERPGGVGGGRMPEMVDVVLSYQDSSFKIYIDLDAPASLFFTQVYLATSVWPPRQKITGFITKEGVVTISPLLPDADFKQLNIQKGMTLTLEM